VIKGQLKRTFNQKCSLIIFANGIPPNLPRLKQKRVVDTCDCYKAAFCIDRFVVLCLVCLEVTVRWSRVFVFFILYSDPSQDNSGKTLADQYML